VSLDKNKEDKRPTNTSVAMLIKVALEFIDVAKVVYVPV